MSAQVELSSPGASTASLGNRTAGVIELPAHVKIAHLETPSPYTEYGVKRAGEGGRMVAPPALAAGVRVRWCFHITLCHHRWRRSLVGVSISCSQSNLEIGTNAAFG
jgi:hypothetical protein